MFKQAIKKWIPAGMIAATLIALHGCGEAEEETLDEAEQKAQEKSDPSDKGGEEEPVNPIDVAK